jgi:hypothetical protein
MERGSRPLLTWRRRMLNGARSPRSESTARPWLCTAARRRRRPDTPSRVRTLCRVRGPRSSTSRTSHGSAARPLPRASEINAARMSSRAAEGSAAIVVAFVKAANAAGDTGGRGRVPQWTEPRSFAWIGRGFASLVRLQLSNRRPGSLVVERDGCDARCPSGPAPPDPRRSRRRTDPRAGRFTSRRRISSSRVRAVLSGRMGAVAREGDSRGKRAAAKPRHAMAAPCKSASAGPQITGFPPATAVRCRH